MALVPRWQRRATHHLPKFLTKANSAGKGSKNYLKYSFWGFFVSFPRLELSSLPPPFVQPASCPVLHFKTPGQLPKILAANANFLC